MKNKPVESMLTFAKSVADSIQLAIKTDFKGVDYLSIVLDKKHFLLKADYCSEVATPHALTPSPLWVSNALYGVAQLNNTLYTVADLRFILSLPKRQEGELNQSRIVYLKKTKYGNLAFLVDDIVGIINIDDDAIVKDNPDTYFLRDVQLANNHVITELDMFDLLNHPVFRGLQ